MSFVPAVSRIWPVSVVLIEDVDGGASDDATLLEQGEARQLTSLRRLGTVPHVCYIDPPRLLPCLDVLIDDGSGDAAVGAGDAEV